MWGKWRAPHTFLSFTDSIFLFLNLFSTTILVLLYTSLNVWKTWCGLWGLKTFNYSKAQKWNQTKTKKLNSYFSARIFFFVFYHGWKFFVAIIFYWIFCVCRGRFFCYFLFMVDFFFFFNILHIFLNVLFNISKTSKMFFLCCSNFFKPFFNNVKTY